MHSLEDSFEELSRSWDIMMDGISGPDYFRSSARDCWEPRLNVYALADQIVVCVELAGIQPGELDIQVDRGVLHIRGRRPKPRVPEAGDEIGVHVMEIDSGRFHRKVPIADAVDYEHCRANYKNGYVWIMLPRSQPSQP